MEVRRAHVEEADAVAYVWLRSRVASIPAIPPPVHSSEQVREYFRLIVLRAQDVWVVESSGAVVALLSLYGEWIEHLYVDPDRCGTGLGTQLLALAKQERPGGLRLWTFEANTGARRFYERHGFAVTGATQGDNEEGAPDVRYEWRP